MKVLTSDRLGGKTTALMGWLANGHEIPTYPGWSRVLIVMSKREVLRLTDAPWAPWVKCIWTFDGSEYAVRHAIEPGSVEYAVDNVEWLIERALRGRFTPSLVSLTGTSEHLTTGEVPS